MVTLFYKSLITARDRPNTVGILSCVKSLFIIFVQIVAYWSLFFATVKLIPFFYGVIPYAFYLCKI